MTSPVTLPVMTSRDQYFKKFNFWSWPVTSFTEALVMTRLITKATRSLFEIIKIDLDKKVHCLRSPHYTRICTCLSRLCISYSFDTRSIGYCHFDIRLYLLKEITNINTIKKANASFPNFKLYLCINYFEFDRA